MKNYSSKSCLECGNIFKPKSSNQKYCVDCRVSVTRRWYSERGKKRRLDPAWTKQDSQQQKAYRARLKGAAFEAYGGPVCACCGESHIGFLTIDHIDNDGAEHRRQTGGKARKLYRWLKANDYPGGFQVLCYNCNCGKSNNGGVCPHKEMTHV